MGRINLFTLLDMYIDNFFEVSSFLSVWDGGNDFQIRLRTFKAVIELLGRNKTKNRLFMPKLIIIF